MVHSNVSELPTWRNKLATRRNGDPLPDERNVRLALETAPDLMGLLQYNAFTDQVELTRPPPGMPRDETDKLFNDDEPIELSDEHVTALTIWLSQQGIHGLRSRTVLDTVVLVAKLASYNPVRDYLEACAGYWDGKPRLDQWLWRYLGAKDNADYLTAVGAKFMIGAVARVMEPGCQMDSVLSLEGIQGSGKTSVVRILGGKWASDLYGDMSDKDAAIGIQGVWIGELAELTSLRRSDQEAVKGFISRRVDHYRPPYGRTSVSRPRHTVFVATTNDDDYLQDATGARRFWPVECGRIDLDAFKRDVKYLWGEAVERYQDKEPWHLDGEQTQRAQVVQKARRRVTPLDDTVVAYAEKQLAVGIKRLEMRTLLQDCLGVDPSANHGTAGLLAQQASRALIGEGWKRLKPVGRYPQRVQAYEYIGPQPASGPLTSASRAQAENEEFEARRARLASRKQGTSVNGSSEGSQVASEVQARNEEIPF